MVFENLADRYPNTIKMRKYLKITTYCRKQAAMDFGWKDDEHR